MKRALAGAVIYPFAFHRLNQLLLLPVDRNQIRFIKKNGNLIGEFLDRIGFMYRMVVQHSEYDERLVVKELVLR